MTTALIDGDICCYRAAWASEAEPEGICLSRLDEMIRRILHETDAEKHCVFLTGDNNYRFEYYSEYKANRKDQPRPQWLQQCREYLVTAWQASIEDGQEADDAMGIYQSSNIDSVICSIDKDLLMIPGNHYNFVKQEWRTVSQVEGIRHFYFQLIMGDRTDNIFGFDGIARQTVPKKLEGKISYLNNLEEEKDMFEFVRDMYDDDTRLLQNGIALWIRRKENEIWKFPN